MSTTHEISTINVVVFNTTLTSATEDVRVFNIVGKDCGRVVRTVELVGSRPWYYRDTPGSGAAHYIPALQPFHLWLVGPTTIIGITRVDAADTIVSCMVVG